MPQFDQQRKQHEQCADQPSAIGYAQDTVAELPQLGVEVLIRLVMSNLAHGVNCLRPIPQYKQLRCFGSNRGARRLT